MLDRVPHDRRADCLFWEGDGPLIARSRCVRRAFCKLRDEDAKEEEEQGTERILKAREGEAGLVVPIKDDDVFRRLLLRTLAVQHKGESQEEPLPTPLPPSLGSSTDCDTVLVEPHLCLCDPSVSLRLIAPLTEYLSATFDRGCAPAPLRLSFAGTSSILIAALEELQRLQRTEANTGTGCFPLLPHKPRIHALHALASRLLRDALRHEHLWPLFPEVSPRHSIHVLRGLVYTSRGLVAAVMTEKKESLRTEGIEGAAVRAGGVADTSMLSVSTLLRNVAHRVLEPALLRYYTALGADEETGMGQDVENCVAELASHAGGGPVLTTACHVLRHPMHHDVTAVVEALRLVALQVLLLHDATALQWAREHATTTIANAFAVVHPGRRGGGKAIEDEHQPTVRMLCVLLLLLHQRCCMLCTEATPHTSCRLFAILRASLTDDGAHCDFSALNFAPEPNAIRAEARWALAEELAATRRRWRWIGRPAALPKPKPMPMSNSPTAAGEFGGGLLLPWSTVAASRHPLRLYDESKQSAAAAEAFDARVDALRRGAVPLRFIGVGEECRFFAHMQECAEVRLSPSVTVVNPDARIKSNAFKSGAMHALVDNTDDYVDILD